MTPQPLSSYPSFQNTGTYTIFTSVHRTVETRPEHSLLVAKVVGKAAFLDSYLHSMLITLLGPHAQASFDMFDAVHQTAKNAALQAAAKRVLTKDDLDMLNAMLTFVRAVDRHRNRIAHGIWATCTEVEDGFLVIDPKESFRLLVEIGKKIDEGKKVLVGPDAPDHDYSQILNYTKANLAEIVNEYDTVHRWLATLLVHVHPKLDEVDPLLRYAQLSREPRLQTALARMRGKGPQPSE